MKTREQCIFEAEQRAKEIERKSKNLGVTKCGNVKTSFGRCSQEYLEGMGFFTKGSDRKPSASAWADKKYDKNVVSIDVKKGESRIDRLVKKTK